MDVTQKLNYRTLASGLGLALFVGIGAGCAPPPTYRPLPPPPPLQAPLPAPVPPPPPVQETVRRPLPEPPRIKEQNLPSTGQVLKETPGVPPPLASPAQPVPQPLPDDSSLLAKITPATPPQRAASLRLTEEGRKLIEAGAAGRGLPRLEQSIAIDSTNPYGYFYLAKAHHKLGRYKESLSFLDVAESRLAAEPYWLAEVYALRGENFRALGMADRAEASFSKALSINSGNRTAVEAISRPPVNPASLPR